MKFHLHVVDGGACAGAAASPADTADNSAVLLFAHMTLRCGHLADVVAVSASTTPAAARQAQLLQQAHGATTGHAAMSTTTTAAGSAHMPHADTGASESDDTRVLQAAGVVLTKAVGVNSAEAQALPYASLADGSHASIVPYAHFATPFAVAEQSLRLAITTAATTTAATAPPPPPPPYFDLVATTDMTTFEYVQDYYQQQRARQGGLAIGGDGRGAKPVAVLHIVAEDPSRAARVLQRVLEMVLKRSGWTLSTDATAAEGGEDDEEDAELNDEESYSEGEGDEEGRAAALTAAVAADGGVGGASGGSAPVGRGGSGDCWLNHMDEAVHLFAQLFGVDVLVALV